jgi:flagellar FliJ protein
MKPFHFSLDSVLELRRNEEDVARQELSKALKEQAEALSVRQQAQQKLEDAMRQTAGASVKTFNAADRSRQWAVQQAQQEICANSEKLLQECVRRAEARRSAVVKARHGRELLERLKQSRREDAEKQAQLEEQILFDELAMSRNHRTAQKGEAKC